MAYTLVNKKTSLEELHKQFSDKHVLCVSIAGSGLGSILLGVAYFANIHVLYYFILVQLGTGAAQVREGDVFKMNQNRTLYLFGFINSFVSDVQSSYFITNGYKYKKNGP